MYLSLAIHCDLLNDQMNPIRTDVEEINICDYLYTDQYTYKY